MARRHEGRDDLAGEHRFTDIGQIILLFVFLVVWVLDSFVFKYSIWATRYVPNYVRVPLAGVFFVASAYLARAGLRTIFGEKRETPRVVREGVFGIVRHPVYLSAILLFLGWILLSLSAFATLVWIGIIIFYHRVSRFEEHLLVKKFGSEYENYMNEVPMWIPRIGKRAGAH